MYSLIPTTTSPSFIAHPGELSQPLRMLRTEPMISLSSRCENIIPISKQTLSMSLFPKAVSSLPLTSLSDSSTSSFLGNNTIAWHRRTEFSRNVLVEMHRVLSNLSLLNWRNLFFRYSVASLLLTTGSSVAISLFSIAVSSTIPPEVVKLRSSCTSGEVNSTPHAYSSTSPRSKNVDAWLLPSIKEQAFTHCNIGELSELFMACIAISPECVEQNCTPSSIVLR